jgi:hypothetical protein
MPRAWRLGAMAAARVAALTIASAKPMFAESPSAVVALHSTRPCFGRRRAKPSIVRINRERDLRISRLADHDRVP